MPYNPNSWPAGAHAQHRHGRGQAFANQYAVGFITVLPQKMDGFYQCYGVLDRREPANRQEMWRGFGNVSLGEKRLVSIPCPNGTNLSCR